MIRPLLSKLIVLTAITTVPLSVIADVDDLRNTQKSNANEWRLHKNDARHKIKVYVKNEEGQKLRSFKVEGIIDAPLETLLRIQSDVENYARWYFEIAEVKLLKKVSDKEFYFYLVHDAPIGLPKRDVILRTVIEPMSKKQ
ncbi:MAG TPA: hypothetical protein PLW01_12380, partial [Agitococcus sp.]|nr:hypothetical protein [Agitococcus sp.]